MKIHLDKPYAPPAPRRTAANAYAPKSLDQSQQSHDEGFSFARLLTTAEQRQGSVSEETPSNSAYAGFERRQAAGRRNENQPAILDTRSVADRRQREHLDIKI